MDINLVGMQTIAVSPKYLSFGCVSQGFIYHMEVTILNRALMSQRFRLSIENEVKCKNTITVIFETSNIAPGISTNVTLELNCDFEDYSHFHLVIEQSEYNANILKIPIQAFIVSLDMFKTLKRALQQRKQPVYVNGVKLKKSIMSTEDRSVITTPSVFSEALLDDDDIDELIELPITSYTYYDNETKELIFEINN